MHAPWRGRMRPLPAMPHAAWPNRISFFDRLFDQLLSIGFSTQLLSIGFSTQLLSIGFSTQLLPSSFPLGPNGRRLLGAAREQSFAGDDQALDLRGALVELHDLGVPEELL